MTVFEFDYQGHGLLSCWSCGEDMARGVLIEWQRGFKQEINCQDCYQILLDNEKDVKVIAIISKQKEAEI